MSIYLKMIYNYICTHVSIEDDIKDIIQDTMLSVWQSIKNFKNQSSFKTWILSIARYKIADYYRAFYKNSTISLLDVENDLIQEERFDNIEESIDIVKSMEILNTIEKEIVFLAFNAQLSYLEISKITKIPVGTIKSKMSSIKHKLKKQLEKGG